MRYKTTIEITSEAEDKNEAMEIVGEYLTGNIVSGVEMRCHTKPTLNYKRTFVGVAALSVIFLIGLITAINIKSSQSLLSNTSGINAIQPPLKTSLHRKDSTFKKEWQAVRNKEALNRITR